MTCSIRNGVTETKHANACLERGRISFVKAAEGLLSQHNKFAVMLGYPFLLVAMEEGKFVAKLRVFPQPVFGTIQVNH